MSLKFENNIFIVLEMPVLYNQRAVGKINILLLIRPSVIRGPWSSFVFIILNIGIRVTEICFEIENVIKFDRLETCKAG